MRLIRFESDRGGGVFVHPDVVVTISPAVRTDRPETSVIKTRGGDVIYVVGTPDDVHAALFPATGIDTHRRPAGVVHSPRE